MPGLRNSPLAARRTATSNQTTAGEFRPRLGAHVHQHPGRGRSRPEKGESGQELWDPAEQTICVHLAVSPGATHWTKNTALGATEGCCQSAKSEKVERKRGRPTFPRHSEPQHRLEKVLRRGHLRVIRRGRRIWWLRGDLQQSTICVRLQFQGKTVGYRWSRALPFNMTRKCGNHDKGRPDEFFSHPTPLRPTAIGGCLIYQTSKWTGIEF